MTTSSPAPSTHTSSYRPDIDGLRAIAVLSVVITHAFPQLLGGGFVGVDIFFVISGFLITRIIHQEIVEQQFTFAAFYGRRARRIFPALSVVLAFALGVGYFVLLPDEFKKLAQHTVGGAAFIANLVFYREVGYFDAPAIAKPLLHLWSLGVEEQFYIVWPLILVAVARWRSRVGVAAGLLAVVSFGINLGLAWTDLSADFYLPFSRFWEFMAGALVALPRRRQTLPPKVAEFASALGLGAVLLACVLLQARDRFPGLWALLPTLGAAAMILSGPSTWVGRVLLSSAPMVQTGRISYSLYLWHWPLFAYAHILQVWSPAMALGLIALSFVLATLSYAFVERPFRHARHAADVRHHTRLSVVGLVVTAVLGLVATQIAPRHRVEIGATAPSAVHPGAGDAAARAPTPNGRWLKENEGLTASDTDGKFLTFRTPMTATGDTTLFIGDSFAIQYAGRVVSLIESHPQANAAQFAIGWGCPPVPGLVEPLRHQHCERYVDHAIQNALDDPHITVVVFAANWHGVLWQPKGVTSDYHLQMPQGKQLSISDGPRDLDPVYRALEAAIKRLTAKKKQVFVILNNPIGEDFNPKNLVQRLDPGQSRPTEQKVDASVFFERHAPLQRGLTDAAQRAGATVIDPTQNLCQNASRCATVRDGVFVYKDNEHLSSEFVQSQASWIDATLLKP